jgi:hypothetical protein
MLRLNVKFDILRRICYNFKLQTNNRIDNYPLGVLAAEIPI